MHHEHETADFGTADAMSQFASTGDYWKHRALLAEQQRDQAKIHGMLEAYSNAMSECWKSERRESGGLGGRTCAEVHKAIDILHLETLQALHKPANAY